MQSSTRQMAWTPLCMQPFRFEEHEVHEGVGGARELTKALMARLQVERAALFES